jgi:hypothetical protein
MQLSIERLVGSDWCCMHAQDFKQYCAVRYHNASLQLASALYSNSETSTAQKCLLHVLDLQVIVNQYSEVT